jgi:alpha-tubulin suppressor-like RCC1 family protein
MQKVALPLHRRVTALRQRAFAVAAANKHTAALVEGGAVFSWGANAEGQLGYGTSDSASNAVPRFVEAMKARAVLNARCAAERRWSGTVSISERKRM